MGIDAGTMAMIVAIPLSAVAGAWLNHWFQKRPKLVTYMVHSEAIGGTGPQGPFRVHTHSVVVRNEGGKSANNVRLGHRVLPDFSLNPSMRYSKETLIDGTVDLVFPVLQPKAQFMVAYLYQPPLTYSEVNTHVHSDEGTAERLNVSPTRQLSKGVTRLAWYLIFAGSVATLYILYEIIFGFLWPLIKMMNS